MIRSTALALSLAVLSGLFGLSGLSGFAVGPARAGEQPVATPKGAVEETPKDDAFVDDSAPPQQQKDALAPFTGTLRCDGKANTELAEDVVTRVTITFKTDLGRFLSVRIEEQKSKQNPHALTSQEVWGFSQALGGLVRNGADSQGGFYSGTSSGWVGDRFFWTTDTVRNGKRVKLKDTFTKGDKGALTFERAIDMSGTGDAYRVFYEGTCKR